MTNQTRSWIWAAGVGAGAMFLLDPDCGRRRRALARDKLVRATRKTRDAAGAVSRDVSHRTSGVVARLRSQYDDEVVDDEIVAERVRSALGRYVSHPGSIDVSVNDGRAILQGPVLTAEVDPLLRHVARVRGVRDIENRLSLHDEPGDVPGLQGGRGPMIGRRGALTQEVWSPTTRLAAGTAGIGLIAGGLRRPTLIRASSLVAGAGLLVRSAANRNLARAAGIRGHRAVDVQKTIHIAAPVEEVFRLWRHYENFPRFMAHVREVEDLGEGRSRWRVDGPGGVPITWEAEVTRFVPDQLISWRSAPGSLVAHEGTVRFDATATGSTRVSVRLSYNPPVGVAGHGAAMLLGADPKSQIDEDLVRMKTLIEEGVRSHDAAQPAGDADRPQVPPPA